jgi:predicted DsbA family dithiol-disulfide isomerase
METFPHLQFKWKTFLLRPKPQEREFEKFKAYTESWLRPAKMETGAIFQPWSTDEGPPSHSVPPHLAAKAAARISKEAFETYHERLMVAYFSENRNITDQKVLREMWGDLGLPADRFQLSEEDEILAEVVGEHNEAVNLGITGVPAVVMDGYPFPVVGVQNDDVYHRLLHQAEA